MLTNNKKRRDTETPPLFSPSFKNGTQHSCDNELPTRLYIYHLSIRCGCLYCWLLYDNLLLNRLHILNLWLNNHLLWYRLIVHRSRGLIVDRSLIHRRCIIGRTTVVADSIRNPYTVSNDADDLTRCPQPAAVTSTVMMVIMTSIVRRASNKGYCRTNNENKNQ